MGYNRIVAPAQPLHGDQLTAALVGIGMYFAVEPAAAPNIEDTLLAAAVEGMEHDDLRVLAVLVTWLGMHHPWVNADRLVRAASQHEAILRERASDVLAPPQVARRHRTYYYRVLMGPSYRADMWAALEQTPTLSVANLARVTYGSFASAWQVKGDWNLLGAARQGVE